MLSDERIKEIERLRAGITPPPWSIVRLQPGYSIAQLGEKYSGALETPPLHDEHADFIAASPTIVDDLLAEREELVAVRDAARELAANLPDVALDEMREVWGNTNTAVVQHWRDNVLAALAGKESTP